MKQEESEVANAGVEVRDDASRTDVPVSRARSIADSRRGVARWTAPANATLPRIQESRTQASQVQGPRIEGSADERYRAFANYVSLSGERHGLEVRRGEPATASHVAEYVARKAETEACSELRRLQYFERLERRLSAGYPPQDLPRYWYSREVAQEGQAAAERATRGSRETPLEANRRLDSGRFDPAEPAREGQVTASFAYLAGAVMERVSGRAALEGPEKTPAALDVERVSILVACSQSEEAARGFIRARTRALAFEALAHELVAGRRQARELPPDWWRVRDVPVTAEGAARMRSEIAQEPLEQSVRTRLERAISECRSFDAQGFDTRALEKRAFEGPDSRGFLSADLPPRAQETQAREGPEAGGGPMAPGGGRGRESPERDARVEDALALVRSMIRERRIARGAERER